MNVPTGQGGVIKTRHKSYEADPNMGVMTCLSSKQGRGLRIVYHKKIGSRSLLTLTIRKFGTHPFQKKLTAPYTRVDR